MAVAKPTIMTAVPRFYQNLYTKINMNFNNQSGLKKFLIFETLQLGVKLLYKTKLSLSEKIVNFICQNLVRKKIRKLTKCGHLEVKTFHLVSLILSL